MKLNAVLFRPLSSYEPSNLLAYPRWVLDAADEHSCWWLSGSDADKAAPLCRPALAGPGLPQRCTLSRS